MLTIARFTLMEAVKNRLFFLALAAVIILFGLAVFVGDLAIAETQHVQAVILASALRLFAITVVSLFVITSMVREFSDKGVEILLSLPLPRSQYYFGKLAAYSSLALIIAVFVSLPLLFFVEFSSVFIWFASLCCELLIIIALSLLSLFTFTNITFAYISVMGFYFLARSIESIQLLSANPIIELQTFSQEFINFFVDIIALVLPNLNSFTNSSWLIYATEMSVLFPVIMQTLIYFSILVCAGLFDLYRKNL